MKQIIMQFCSENGIPFTHPVGCSRDVTKTVVAGSLAAQQAVKLLANFLVRRFVSSKNQEQNKAAYGIRLFTKTSIFNRSCLVEAGAIPPLLNLLSSNDPIMQGNAMASLLNLSKFSRSRRIIVENGGLIFIPYVLKEGLNMEARQHAAGTFFYLASVEEYRMLIEKIPEAIPALMELLRDGMDRAKRMHLSQYLASSYICPDNHWRVLAAGL